jgi:hypothetical protein
MSHSLVCWRCGASLAALTLPLRRLEICKACNAELHVCKMCGEYDISYAKHCKEPTAEEVRKKDEANFCVSTSPRLFEITKVVPWSAATGLVQYVLL